MNWEVAVDAGNFGRRRWRHFDHVPDLAVAAGLLAAWIPYFRTLGR